MPSCHFVCQKCPSRPVFGTLGESALHQKSHLNDKNFVFICQWPSCDFQFLTYTALETHILRFHKQFRDIPHESSEFMKCNVAGCDNVFLSSKLLCYHLIRYHLIQLEERVQCPFMDVCKSNYYFPLPSFRTHLAQKHRGWNTSMRHASPNRERNVMDENEVSESYDCNVNDIFVGCVDDDYDDGIEENIQPPGEDLLFNAKEEFTRNLAMFYLRLESQHHIPVKTLEVIADGIAQLATASQFIVKKTIEGQLDELGVEDVHRREQVINTILFADCLYACHVNHSNLSLRTNARRKTFYKKHFKFIEPVEINLSKDPSERRCIYYVPINETMEVLTAQYREEIIASFNRSGSNGVIEDYTDGSLYQKRQHNIGTKTIDLFLYQDSFTGTRESSSAADHNDILGMYMTLGNLKLPLRSKVDSNQCIMLIPNFKRIFKDFKVKCFNIVMRAIRKLECDGIDFEGERVKVKLQFLLGDNKGQHEVGGFIQCFSQEYFCRFCPMTRTEILQEPWQVAPLRTPEDYEEAARSVPANRATFKGVSGQEYLCPFNKLQNFHVCDSSLAPCIAHDIFEGILNYDLVPIFKHLSKEKKWFTYEVFNRRVKKFNYLDSDLRNKPATLKFPRKKTNSDGESKLGGHAVQNWTLFRLLPFILDDLIIEPEDDHWKLYLLLKQIVEYVCAPAITYEQLSHLKILIEDYAVQRQEILGPGKPKHHFLVHYPDLIEIMGPIYHLQTLRFESFHQFFLRAARAGRNFKCIGLSLIRKYCLHFAYLNAGSPFNSGVRLLEEGVTISMMCASHLEDSILSALHLRNIGDDALLMNSIVVDEVLLKKGKWLLLRNGDESVIVVGLIQYIVLDGSQVSLILKEYNSKPVRNIGIYKVEVQLMPSVSCIPVNELKYPCSHSMYSWGEHELCFSLKNSLAY